MPRGSLANAVYHKAYDVREPIEVRIEKDKIEILSFPGPDRSVTVEALKNYNVFVRRYRNRRIGDFLKELHLTEGRNTGIRKILNALEKNGSPLPESITDEDHSYFITRLFIRDGFYDYDNVVENVAEELPPTMASLLSGFTKKKREAAMRLALAILENSQITISEMAAISGMTTRTVQRYLKEFQDVGAMKRTGSDKSGERILL